MKYFIRNKKTGEIKAHTVIRGKSTAEFVLNRNYGESFEAVEIPSNRGDFDFSVGTMAGGGEIHISSGEIYNEEKGVWENQMLLRATDSDGKFALVYLNEGQAVSLIRIMREFVYNARA